MACQNIYIGFILLCSIIIYYIRSRKREIIQKQNFMHIIPSPRPFLRLLTPFSSVVDRCCSCQGCCFCRRVAVLLRWWCHHHTAILMICFLYYSMCLPFSNLLTGSIILYFWSKSVKQTTM